MHKFRMDWFHCHHANADNRGTMMQYRCVPLLSLFGVVPPNHNMASSPVKPHQQCSTSQLADARFQCTLNWLTSKAWILRQKHRSLKQSPEVVAPLVFRKWSGGRASAGGNSCLEGSWARRDGQDGCSVQKCSHKHRKVMEIVYEWKCGKLSLGGKPVALKY